MRHDLEQKVRRGERGCDRGVIQGRVLVAHGAGRDADRAVVERPHHRVDLRTQRRLSELLRKTPQLAAAGDRRMIVEKHAVRIAAFAALERNRDDLPALGVIAEAGRVGHADELELDQRLIDLKRLRHELAQLLGIGAVGDDEEFAIDEAIGTDRLGRTGQRHCKRPLPHLALFHDARSCFRIAPESLL